MHLPSPLQVFGDDLARVKDLVELVQKARMNKILAGLATLQVRRGGKRGQAALVVLLAAAAASMLLTGQHWDCNVAVRRAFTIAAPPHRCALSGAQGAMTVKLNNLAAMEINAVRPFFLGSLDMFHRFQRMEEAALGGGSQLGGSQLGGSAQAAPARQLRRGAAA